MFSKGNPKAAIPVVEHLKCHQRVEHSCACQRYAKVEAKQPPVLCILIELQVNKHTLTSTSSHWPISYLQVSAHTITYFNSLLHNKKKCMDVLDVILHLCFIQDSFMNTKRFKKLQDLISFCFFSGLFSPLSAPVSPSIVRFLFNFLYQGWSSVSRVAVDPDINPHWTTIVPQCNKYMCTMCWSKTDFLQLRINKSLNK